MCQKTIINSPSGGSIDFRIGNVTWMDIGPIGGVRLFNVGGPPSGGRHVCWNDDQFLALCDLSSIRFKTDVNPFNSGLNLIKRLRPVSFNWKEGGKPDIGLGAEDVAKVAPSFTFTDSKGEITGAKYDRLNILLINAVKEQQKQIATLLTSNAALNARLRVVEKALRRKAGSARRRR